MSETTASNVALVDFRRRLMLPGGADHFVALGWSYAEHGLEECVGCHTGTVFRDPAGTPRHTWCEAPRPKVSPT